MPRRLGAQFTAEDRIASVGRDSTIRVGSPDGKSEVCQPAGGIVTHESVRVVRWQAGDYQGRIVIWDGQKTVTLAAMSENVIPISAHAR